MAAKLWTILALLAISQAVRGSGVILSNNPNVIQTIITQEMAMKCSIDTTGGGDLKFVTSLVITRDGIQVASITPFAPVAVFTDQGKLNATGHVSTQNGADGELNLIWNYPDEGQAGNYTCDVNGVNSVGHPVSYTAVVNVPVRQPTLADITNYVGQQQKVLEKHRLDNQYLMAENVKHKTQVRDLKAQMKIQQREMSQVQNLTTETENKMATVSAMLKDTRLVENGTVVCGDSNSWTDIGSYREIEVTTTYNKTYTTAPILHASVNHVSNYNSNSNFAYSVKYWVDVIDSNESNFTIRCRTDGSVSTSYYRFYEFDVAWFSIGNN